MDERAEEQRIKRYLKGCFPQIGERIPKQYHFAKFDGITWYASHNLVSIYNWLNSSGFERFVQDKIVPDGFFSCGFKSPATMEYVFAMWRDGERYFWFYDVYVVYICKSNCSVENTRKNLDVALGLWNEGRQHVISMDGRIIDYDDWMARFGSKSD